MKVKTKKFIGGGQPVAPHSPSRSRKKAYKARLRKAKVQRGQALVLALCFIVLCTVLVVAFLTNVTTSKIGEKAAASENSATQLALSAVQLMESTITYATEPGTDTSIAWACQPGMIRTYGSGGGVASSAPLAYYKLYSSGTMILNATTGFSFAGDAPGNWDTFPSLYTDMNAPITTEVANTTGSTVTIFPIVDPRAADLGVEGFSFSSGTMHGVTTTGTGLGLYISDTTSRLAMPVQWIYVLRDGSMTAPTSGGATSATFGATVSGTNPIVGRIAFWTDDESAKVNINTASEGTYWDTPIANSGSSGELFNYPQTGGIGDYAFGANQPAQHEYQRYPGHPATTCLSSVFGYALTGTAILTGSLRGTQLVKPITNVIPRVSDTAISNGNAINSTMGGTMAVSATGSAVALAVDMDRLYANLDEFQFSPNPPGSTAPRTVQALGNATIKQQDIQTCRFFLTAHSKAPEVNMFGLPRVSIWPLWDDNKAAQRTIFEQEILRCSTVATGTNSSGTRDPHEMAFFREYPLSSSTDWNIQQTIGLLAPQARNQLVFQYLQTLTARNVPGFGSNFLSKYPAAPGYNVTDRDQILTEVFDYIRCTNLLDNSTGATSYTLQTSGTDTQTGQVVPIRIPLTSATSQGLGRIGTIAEMALVITKADDRINTNTAESGSNMATTVTVAGWTGSPAISNYSPSSQTLVEWALVPMMASPMAGWVGLASNLRIRFSNIGFNFNGTAVTTGSIPDVYCTGRFASNRDGNIGGIMGPDMLTDTGGAPNDSAYPTGLALINGTSSGGSMTLSGSLTATIYAPAGTASAPGPQLQAFNFNFPSMVVPIPAFSQITSGSNTVWMGSYRAPRGAYSGGTNATLTYPSTAVKSSLTRYVGQGNPNLVYGGLTSANRSVDVIRSLVPTGPLGTGTSILGGDLRLISISPRISGTTYALTLTGTGVAPSSSTFCADSMREGPAVVTIAGAAFGTLSAYVTSAGYYDSSSQTQTYPFVPPQPTSGVGSVPSSGPFPGAGDWDNGIGMMYDGPWANKPDEGTTTASAPYYFYDYQTLMSAAFQAPSLFSPNRELSSPVMFGSLPVGFDHPWQTLLFRPATLPGFLGGYTHPGNNPGVSPAQIPDHLLLDLFWMPVVEPYGVSEPLTTAGKINLNFQLAPFTYITRQTGLNAVLKSVMVTAINPTPIAARGKPFAMDYHDPLTFGGPAYASSPLIKTRFPIDATQTFSLVATGSDSTNAYPEFGRATNSVSLPNFFVSASQICDVPLVPIGYTPATLSTFWAANALTGDNSLERPYSLIYPRVTTKSNIFTVHVVAQSLKKITSDPNQAVWNENVDQVTGEFRGAFTIEKYFDPNSDDITDSTGAVQAAANDGAIAATAAIRNTKWRVLEVKRFGQ